MSNENALTSVEQNTALSKNNGKMPLVCDLQTKGSEIYLPQTQPLDLAAPEYEKTLLQTLPEDIAPEVASVLKAKRRPFTAFRIILIVVFIAVAFWCTYRYFPRQAVIKTDKIGRDDLEISYAFNAVTVKASEALNENRYRDVIALLEEPALKISNDATEIRKNGKLLGLYFDAEERTKDYSLNNPQEIISNIIKNDPDRLGWRLDYLSLYFPECRRIGQEAPNYDRAQEILKVLPDYKPENWKDAPDYENNKDVLNLYFARLNYCYWCLLTPTNKLNKESPGVKEREIAYQITKGYTEGDKISKDFLQLQVDILQTIKNAGIGWGDWEGSIYFDGRKYWREDTFIRESGLETKKRKLEEMER